MSDLYLVQPGDSADSRDLNQIVRTLDGQNDAPVVSYQPLSAPGALTAQVSSSSGVLNGSYSYLTVFLTGNVDGQGTIHWSGNHSAAGTASAVVNPANNQVDLSDIPIGPTGVVARELYRTKAGGSTFYYLDTIDDNVVTDYTDNTADSSLGSSTAPTHNTTGSPPELPVYDAVPSYTAPKGSLVFVQGSSTLLLYQSTGSGWEVSAPPIPKASTSTTGIVEVTAPAISGTITVPAMQAAPGEVELTTTSATTIYSVTPPNTGMFMNVLYARVVTATTTVSATIIYTSNGGSQTYDIWSNQSMSVDDHAAIPFTFQNVGGDTVKLSCTAGTANQVYIDARLVAL